jgi:Na+/H+ antiporter NhaD/arsenite permease-like protein
VVTFAIVAGYALALRALQSRSDMANVLSGLPSDERWVSINLRALSFAGQVIAVVLVVAYLVTQFSGGDSTAYAQLGAVGPPTRGLVWYRARS